MVANINVIVVLRIFLGSTFPLFRRGDTSDGPAPGSADERVLVALSRVADRSSSGGTESDAAAAAAMAATSAGAPPAQVADPQAAARMLKVRPSLRLFQ